MGIQRQLAVAVEKLLYTPPPNKGMVSFLLLHIAGEGIKSNKYATMQQVFWRCSASASVRPAAAATAARLLCWFF